MDYEKNKTLAILKQMVADGKITQEDAEKYFPEISGERDEVIKKTLIQFLKKKKTGMYNGIMLKEMVEWVEKRSEPMKVLLYEINDYCASITKCPHGQKSRFIDAAAFVGSLSCERCPYYGGKAGSREIYCKYKEKQGWQKPVEWSEEDEKTKDNLISELSNLATRRLIKNETYSKYTTWLKSIRQKLSNV